MDYASYKNKLETKFKEYTDRYDSSATKIRLKIYHTSQVATLSEQIAASLNLSDEDILIAWTCGMLHDIGRFEQLRRFDTFIDSISVDHANFGADLLFKEGLYEEMVDTTSSLAPDQKDLIEKVIRVHSAFRIPEDYTDREKMFSNILRDADKLDIFRVNTEVEPSEIFNKPMEEIRASYVSDEVKNAFNEKRCIKRDERHTPIDFFIAHICLVFELVYPKSARLADEMGYLRKMLSFKPTNEETAEWFIYMNETIRKFIDEKCS